MPIGSHLSPHFLDLIFKDRGSGDTQCHSKSISFPLSTSPDWRLVVRRFYPVLDGANDEQDSNLKLPNLVRIT
jgi:hypothetical protein